ncbi:MAG: hypothetical protein GY755_21995, partial [Chloroflexi bacterium]|nr:hypothetical protein [Chloroflexota bacterium]
PTQLPFRQLGDFDIIEMEIKRFVPENIVQRFIQKKGKQINLPHEPHHIKLNHINSTLIFKLDTLKIHGAICKLEYKSDTYVQKYLQLKMVDSICKYCGGLHPPFQCPKNRNIINELSEDLEKDLELKYHNNHHLITNKIEAAELQWDRKCHDWHSRWTKCTSTFLCELCGGKHYFSFRNKYCIAVIVFVLIFSKVIIFFYIGLDITKLTFSQIIYLNMESLITIKNYTYLDNDIHKLKTSTIINQIKQIKSEELNELNTNIRMKAINKINNILNADENRRTQYKLRNNQQLLNAHNNSNHNNINIQYNNNDCIEIYNQVQKDILNEYNQKSNQERVSNALGNLSISKPITLKNMKSHTLHNKSHVHSNTNDNIDNINNTNNGNTNELEFE